MDVAALPSDADTLKVNFTLRVLGGTGKPSACNDADYQENCGPRSTVTPRSTVSAELARRYAFNLANGRFLWRNRIGAESVEVQVAHLSSRAKAKNVWTFDALSLPLRSFEASAETGEKLDVLTSLIAGGLQRNPTCIAGDHGFRADGCRSGGVPHRN